MDQLNTQAYLEGYIESWWQLAIHHNSRAAWARVYGFCHALSLIVPTSSEAGENFALLRNIALEYETNLN